MNYVSEVQNVIDAGLPEQVAVGLYNVITEKLERISGHPETNIFRARVKELKKEELGYFHVTIDAICKQYPLPIKVDWRLLKYEPERITRCEVCSRYFYDVSRNGRSLTCSDDCQADYYRFTRTGGTAIDPIYSRNVQEIPIDFSPSSDDALGYAMLNKVEDVAQEQLNQEVSEIMDKLDYLKIF